MMTREQFKDLAMDILLNQRISLFGKNDWQLFHTEDISDMYVGEHDEYDEEVACMPMEEFLGDLYDAIWGEVDE